MQDTTHERDSISRRAFLAGVSLAGAAGALAGCGVRSPGGVGGPRAGGARGLGRQLEAEASQKHVASRPPLFTISLAQWSLHRMLYDKKLDHLDFPKYAKEKFGIDAVEYVNAFFAKKGDGAYDRELRHRCDDLGVTSVLIMCDGEGNLGDPDAGLRVKAVRNHQKWLDAAKTLGCHSIRVNASSKGSFEEQQKLAADGLRHLCELADPMGLNVIVENHWGLSSHGGWLSGVMRMVGHPRVGTLPDFGNFDPKEYDRYQGVTDMMPFAKGVSAKSYEFDLATGLEKRVDYERMLRIVLGAGYRGRIGVEYEGEGHSEDEGVVLTKSLLERLREKLAAEFV